MVRIVRFAFLFLGLIGLIVASTSIPIQASPTVVQIATYPPSGTTLTFPANVRAGSVVIANEFTNGTNGPCTTEDLTNSVNLTTQVTQTNIIWVLALASYLFLDSYSANKTYSMTGTNCGAVDGGELIEISGLCSATAAQTGSAQSDNVLTLTTSNTAGGLAANSYSEVYTGVQSAGTNSVTVNGNSMTRDSGGQFWYYLNSAAFGSAYSATANYSSGAQNSLIVLASWTGCATSVPQVPWIGAPLFEEIIHLLG